MDNQNISTYDKLMEIYRKHSNDGMFVLAITYIINKGQDMVSGITEEQIQSVKDNGIMSAEFSQNIIRTAKEINEAVGESGQALYQFCQAESIFETEYFAGKMLREEMLKCIEKLMLYITETKGFSREYIATEIMGIEPEDLETIK